MSANVAKKIDQKEYLKRYLSGDKKKKKKKDKDKKHKKDVSTVKIIDDDVNAQMNDIDEELLLTGEDAPQIVGEYIETQPNGSEASKWRSIAIKEEEEEGRVVKTEAEEEQSLWGRKASVVRKKDAFSPNRKKQQSPDMSPRRKYKTDKSLENGNSKGDQSPQRRQRRYSSDQSPPRRGKSPNRKNSVRRENSRGRDQSPIRRRRHDSDNSPPRKRQHSPPRFSRKTSRSPRRQHSSNASPARKGNQHVQRRRRRSSSNQSPSRRRNSDQSPPRKREKSPSRYSRKHSKSPTRRRDSDQSPPRNRNEQNTQRQYRRSSLDKSPVRKRDLETLPTRIKQEKRDNTPTRRDKVKAESPPAARSSRWEKAEPTKSPSPPPTHKPKGTKTLDGKTAGLQNAQGLKTELEERRRQEDGLYAKMSSEMSGRDAEVQVRNTGRRGKRARDAEAEDPETQRRKEAHELKKKQLYDRWGKGLKQLEEHQTRKAEHEYESSKPLARYANDEDLDRHLREQERADDPMLQYMREKNKQRQKQANLPTIPVYQGTYPENRFGIRPGYRWDGVDRSNGYEKNWFDVQSEKRAIQDDAYKYSVEDM